MILSINANNLNYDIVIERNSLSKAREYLSLNRKVFVITDSGVPSVYSETILNQCKDGYIFTFKNGEETVYAKKQKGLQIPEPNTTPFHSIDKVMSQTNEAFEVGSVDKYTIVVWLEGNDPECIDNIIGGRVRLEMNFKVTEVHK